MVITEIDKQIKENCDDGFDVSEVQIRTHATVISFS